MILIALLAVLIPLFLLGILNMSARSGMTISAIIVALTGYFFLEYPKRCTPCFYLTRYA